ncbi:MAG: c-type cytochrome [Phenylobacterium sp.]
MVSRRSLLTFLAGAAASLAFAGLGGLAYVETGAFNVAAARPHSPLVAWATKTMMVRSVKLRARGIAAPARFSTAQVQAGFRDYDAHCVTCHGAPAIGAREASADGMTPVPPYLVDAAKLWSPAELYWIIRNGVKMTGMPAWDRERSPAETWSLVAFLEALPKMPPTAYAQMRETERTTDGVSARSTAKMP